MSRPRRSHLAPAAAILGAAALAASASAVIPASENFEGYPAQCLASQPVFSGTIPGSPPAWWVQSGGEYRAGDNTAGLVVPVGSGCHGIPSATGSGHAEVYPRFDYNLNGGFEDYHRYGGGQTANPGYIYSVKQDIYLHPDWTYRSPQGGAGAEDDFWYNSSVRDSTTGDYLTESSLRMNVTDNFPFDATKEYSFHVNGNAVGSLWRTTTPGWYTFETIFVPQGAQLFTRTRVWNVAHTQLLADSGNVLSWNNADGTKLGGNGASFFFYVHPNLADNAGRKFVAIDNVSVGPPIEPAELSLTAPDTCIAAGEQLEVHIDLTRLVSPGSVVGGQFFLQYDKNALQFVSANPGNPPFQNEIYEVVDQSNGAIDYATGVIVGPGPGTNVTPSTMAVLRFNVLQNSCSTAADLVKFRARPSPLPPTRVTNSSGSDLAVNTNDLPSLRLDQSAPSIAAPPSVTMDADAGLCTATLKVVNTFSAPVSTCANPAPNCFYADRYPPAGFQSDPFNGGTLKHSISAADSAANRPPTYSSTFYNTQGRGFDTNLPVGGTLAIDLWIPSSWQTSVRRADIWGVGHDSQDSSNLSYPIIGFTSNDPNDALNPTPANPTPRYRVWDDINGVWIDLATPVTYNAWHRLSITLTATDWVYKIDNAVVATQPNSGTVRIGSAIIQAYNFGQSYDVFWDNFLFGPAGPVATDNCTVAAVTYTRSDSTMMSPKTLADPFPTGVTTVTWTATDSCGNSSSANQTVTVNAVNNVDTVVELEGVSAGPFTRCITFTLTGAGCTGPVTVDVPVTFTAGTGSASFQVPCGLYSCITAKDRLHTLRSTDQNNFGISGVRYASDFTGADKLLGGNLNGDYYIDILDFGVLVGQYGTNPGANTTCSTSAPHADISGDGTVGSGDYTYIQQHFLALNEADCCSNVLRLAPPVERISVRELRATGRADLAKADLNADGWLDAQDMAWFAAHGGLPKASDFNRDGEVSIHDIFDFLTAWFNADLRADVNLNNANDILDIFQFLNAWFAGV
jgi:hypothetical protein